MKVSVTIIISLICLLCPFQNSFSQTKQPDNCLQYQQIIDHIQGDTTALKTYFKLDSICFQFNEKVFLSAYSPFFLHREYIAEVLKKDSSSFYNKNKSKLIEGLHNASTNAKEIEVSCLKKEVKNGNLLLSFFKDENAIAADLSLITNGYTKGIYFLFFFDQSNKIRKFYKTKWIE